VRVAITGATGFVGGALVQALAAEGHEIVAVVRPSSSKEIGRGLRSMHGNSVTWRDGDVTDPATLRGLFDGLDWLIHAAGMLGQAGTPEAVYFRIHERGTANVLAEAQRAGLKRVLYISSPGVLGPINPRVHGDAPADESAPLAPSNPYERSKAAAEQVALAFAQNGLPVVIVRPEFIYGPGDWHVLGLFKAVRNGRFFVIDGGRHTCHPTYIEDAVTGMIQALNHGKVGHIYHITGPEPVTFRELGNTIAAVLNVPSPRYNLPRWLAWLGAAGLELLAGLVGRRPPLSRTGVAFFSEDRRLSWRKAYLELKYKPQFDLKRGVMATVAWYRENNLL
jgi:nucleoside-diphosphate-sugar epimerase